MPHYAEGMDPDIAERYPYWRYVAVGDSRTRPEHAALNGKIFKKTDPIWNTIFPPNGFNCRCYVEDVGEEDVNPNAVARGSSVKPETAKINQSAFRFNPRNAFASWDLSAIKDPQILAAAKEKLADEEAVRKAFGVRIFPGRVANGKMKYVTAKELGAPNISLLSVAKSSELRDDHKTAYSRLTIGEDIIAKDGSNVHFGSEILTHWEHDKSQPYEETLKSRLGYLTEAKDAVKNATECFVNESERIYSKVYIDSNNRKYVMNVFVDNNGNVRSYYVSSIAQYEKNIRKGIGYESFN